MTLTPTQRMISDWLELHGPAKLSRIAQEFGITTDTAGVHMNNLMRAGCAHSNCRGQASSWRAGPRQQRESFANTPPAISQCPSVWAYAERMRTLDTQSESMV